MGTESLKVFTGLREDEVRDAGFDPLTIAGTYFDHKAYYPGAQNVALLLTGDRQSGHLLGAQMAGAVQTAVAKLIDVVATTLFHRMSVEALSDLDLSYTPPLGSPWDLLQMGSQGGVLAPLGKRCDLLPLPNRKEGKNRRCSY